MCSQIVYLLLHSVVPYDSSYLYNHSITLLLYSHLYLDSHNNTNSYYLRKKRKLSFLKVIINHLPRWKSYLIKQPLTLHPVNYLVINENNVSWQLEQRGNDWDQYQGRLRVPWFCTITPLFCQNKFAKTNVFETSNIK